MRIAEKSDRAFVVDILSSSFQENISINDIVKQDQHRKDRIQNLMAYCFDICFRKGAIYLEENQKACALVLNSDIQMNTLDVLRFNLKLIVKSVGISRIMSVLRREKKLNKFHPETSHYYLWLLGVLPAFQKQGIGSGFLRKVIVECDKKWKPIFLETSTHVNINFYQNVGFKLFKELNLGYPMYLMMRD